MGNKNSKEMKNKEERYIPSKEEFNLDCEKLIKLSEIVINRFPDSCFVNNNGGVERCLDLCKDLNDYYDMEFTSDELINCFEDYILPCCGCGDPNEVRRLMYRLLKAHSNLETSSELVKEIFPSIDEDSMLDAMYQFTLHSLEKCEFVSHGFSIYNATLTETGKVFLDLCELYYKYLDLEDYLENSK